MLIHELGFHCVIMSFTSKNSHRNEDSTKLVLFYFQLCQYIYIYIYIYGAANLHSSKTTKGLFYFL